MRNFNTLFFPTMKIERFLGMKQRRLVEMVDSLWR